MEHVDCYRVDTERKENVIFKSRCALDRGNKLITTRDTIKVNYDLRLR